MFRQLHETLKGNFWPSHIYKLNCLSKIRILHKSLEKQRNWVFRGRDVEEVPDGGHNRFLIFDCTLSSGVCCWNMNSSVSNLLILLCFETVEKGKGTTFKDTSQNSEIQPMVLWEGISLQWWVHLVFFGPPQSHKIASSVGLWAAWLWVAVQCWQGKWAAACTHDEP